MTNESAVTSTVVLTAATGSFTTSVNSLRSCTSTTLLNVLNPWDLIVTLYRPAVSCAALHPPEGPVMPITAAALPGFLSRVTSALGITAPCWSTTMSLIPESFCWLWLHSQVGGRGLFRAIATVAHMITVSKAAARRETFRVSRTGHKG